MVNVDTLMTLIDCKIDFSLVTETDSIDFVYDLTHGSWTMTTRNPHFTIRQFAYRTPTVRDGRYLIIDGKSENLDIEIDLSRLQIRRHWEGRE